MQRDGGQTHRALRPVKSNVWPEVGGDEAGEVEWIACGDGKLRERQSDAQRLRGQDHINVQLMFMGGWNALFPDFRPKFRGVPQHWSIYGRISTRDVGLKRLQVRNCLQLSQSNQLASQLVVHDLGHQDPYAPLDMRGEPRAAIVGRLHPDLVHDQPEWPRVE